MAGVCLKCAGRLQSKSSCKAQDSDIKRKSYVTCLARKLALRSTKRGKHSSTEYLLACKMTEGSESSQEYSKRMTLIGNLYCILINTKVGCLFQFDSWVATVWETFYKRAVSEPAEDRLFLVMGKGQITVQRMQGVHYRGPFQINLRKLRNFGSGIKFETSISVRSIPAAAYWWKSQQYNFLKLHKYTETKPQNVLERLWASLVSIVFTSSFFWVLPGEMKGSCISLILKECFSAFTVYHFFCPEPKLKLRLESVVQPPWWGWRQL